MQPSESPVGRDGEVGGGGGGGVEKMMEGENDGGNDRGRI